MVLTIAPSVRGASERQSRGDSPVFVPFTLGATLSGASVFGLVGALGAIAFAEGAPGETARPALAVAIGIVAAAYGVSYVARRPLPLRHTDRQVPKVWREAFSRRVAALLYGLGLGLGFFTKVPYLTFYVALAFTFVAAQPAAGLAAGAVFGLARSAPLAVFKLTGVPLGAGERVTESLARVRPVIDAVNGLALAVGGLTVIVMVP